LEGKLWDAIAGVVAILFSVILWFSWLGLQDFGITSVIDTSITWLIGVIILVVGAKIIGFLGDKMKATLKIEGSSIWDALTGVVAVLITVIIWFQWLGTQSFGTVTVIETAITWIVSVLILTIGAIFVGYFESQLDEQLKV